MDPGTAMLIATAIASASKAGGDYLSSKKGKKASKTRAKEMKRETQSDLIHQALQRSAELQSHQLASRQKTGKRRVNSLQETSNLVRGALSI